MEGAPMGIRSIESDGDFIRAESTHHEYLILPINAARRAFGSVGNPSSEYPLVRKVFPWVNAVSCEGSAPAGSLAELFRAWSEAPDNQYTMDYPSTNNPELTRSAPINPEMRNVFVQLAEFCESTEAEELITLHQIEGSAFISRPRQQSSVSVD